MSSIQNIISTDIGKQVQDQLLDEQRERYVNEAIELGVTDQLILALVVKRQLYEIEQCVRVSCEYA